MRHGKYERWQFATLYVWVSEAMPILKAGLYDENRHVRHVCITALGILGIQDASDDLIKLLTDDPDPIVRGQTAQVLGQTGYTAAVAALDKAAKQDKKLACSASGKIGYRSFQRRREN